MILSSLVAGLAGPAAAAPVLAATAMARRGCCALHAHLRQPSPAAPGPDDGTPASVARAATAAAQRKARNLQTLKPLAEAARAHAASGALTPPQLRELATSFASLGFFDAPLQGALASAMLPQLRAFGPADLAASLHALGLAQHNSPQLTEAALACVEARADAFSADDLAKVLFAYGRIGYRTGALERALRLVTGRLPAGRICATLADVICAEAEEGWADPRLTAVVAAHVAGSAAAYDASSLSRVVASLALLKHNCGTLAEPAARRACELYAAGAMAPSQLVEVVWALGVQGRHHAGLMAVAAAAFGDAAVVASLPRPALGRLAAAYRGLRAPAPAAVLDAALAPAGRRPGLGAALCAGARAPALSDGEGDCGAGSATFRAAFCASVGP